MISFINTFDYNAMLWIQEHIRSFVLSAILIPITESGNAGLLFIGIALVMLFFKKTRKCGILMLISMLVCSLLNNVMVKNIVKRPRPFTSYSTLIPLIPPPGQYSFPSGHTAAAFSCMTVLFFTHRKYAYAGILLATIMGFSRIYVGVHYPSDVIAGAVIGIVTACVIGYIYKKRCIGYEKK